MTTIIEQMARAYCEADGLDPDMRAGGDMYAMDPNKVGGGPRNWERVVPGMLAILAAMREPTEAMNKAGGEVEVVGQDDWTHPIDDAAEQAWKVMIDAAIAEGESA